MHRRSLIKTAAGAAGAAALAAISGNAVRAAEHPYAPPEEGALPPSAVELDRGRAVLLVVDPLVDFLDLSGAAWDVVKDNVRQLNTIENLERLFRAAHDTGLPVVISPHYHYPYDHQWAFGGSLVWSADEADERLHGKI